MTNAQTLKAKIIDLLTFYITEKENDITTGIEDGLYSTDENESTLQEIADGKKLIEEFKAYTPTVYVYIEDGNLQDASGTEPMTFDLFDKDNYEQMTEYDQKINGSPEQWDEQIKDLTGKNEIVEIY